MERKTYRHRKEETEQKKDSLRKETENKKDRHWKQETEHNKRKIINRNKEVFRT